MNITFHKMPMIWGTLVLMMGLLYACPDADADSEDSTPTLKAGDITYDSIAQGTAGTATPKSSTIRDLSTLKFSIAPIGTYTGAGEQTPPTIDEEDGSITTTATTNAGSYRVTITPDGITILGNPITVDFYVTIKAMNIGDLDTKLQQAITDYGLTGDFNYIDTSEVTDMSYLFALGFTPGSFPAEEDSTRDYVKNFNGDISKWDVSSVTNFRSMFAGAIDGAFAGSTIFNQDISKWNVTAGTNFSAMFYSAAKFNQNIGKWNVTAGTNFSSMFRGAHAFNQNIGGWTVTAGTDFSSMFLGADAFNQDISEWKVSAGKDFSSMFNGATAFNQNIGKWNVSAGEKFIAMFQGATEFNQDISEWTVTAGQYFNSMFNGATKFNQNIGKWTVTAGTDFRSMFQGATAFTQDVSGWELNPDSVNITDMFKDSGVTDLPDWYTQTP